MGIFEIFMKNIPKFDWLIIAAALANGRLYWFLKQEVDRLYSHFNPSDKLASLSDEAVEKLRKNTKEKEGLSSKELLDIREKMNKRYALYSNLTTMFPLFGMLGTVVSLIPMVNTMGTTDLSNFFSALTSTFWGIVAAILFKGLDATLSYKIEDNEKHIEYLAFKK